MKQLLFLLLTISVVSLTVVSCSKSDDTTEPSGTTSNSGGPVNNYCPEIDDWVLNNYPNETIDSVLLVTGTVQNTSIEIYQVYLSNGVIAEFNVNAVFGLPPCTLLTQTQPCGCPYTYNPVCWNNVEYDNECLAICAGANPADIIPGTCTPCGCPSTYSPVCWAGTTYDNECLAVCAGANPGDPVPGACGSCGCPTNDDPVCWNNTTYMNECHAICAGANPGDPVPGACPQGSCINTAVVTIFPGVNATIVNIVSGYSNVNYGNAFYEVTVNVAGTQVVIYFDEFCNYYSICGCAPTVSFVCLNGQTTYINQCEAECASNSTNNITPGPC